MHTRPRLGSIDISTLPAATPAHGGLSPSAMRRVQEYVEVHLGENIDLSMLAGVAGLSLHHFARQFKQSAGVTPHVYLTQTRVERAGNVGSDGSPASANCVRCGVFRSRSSSPSFPSHARHNPLRVSLVARIEDLPFGFAHSSKNHQASLRQHPSASTAPVAVYGRLKARPSISSTHPRKPYLELRAHAVTWKPALRSPQLMHFDFS
ncbi:hypothetical protein SAMN05443247_10621 [Bradyrhizobium erythrophlei]|jgi:hypothetical protein|nr:hypothetical protein SAMN05443247_10621 [Bradyrhizobium erythrophlei]